MIMIVLAHIKLDPTKMDKNEIKSILTSYFNEGNKFITVEWFDLSLDQTQIQFYYMELVHDAQKMGFDVYCIMSQRVAEHLVRYKRLMFVDTIFLGKFKFKEIKFTLPYNRPDLMR